MLFVQVSFCLDVEADIFCKMLEDELKFC